MPDNEQQRAPQINFNTLVSVSVLITVVSLSFYMGQKFQILDNLNWRVTQIENKIDVLSNRH